MLVPSGSRRKVMRYREESKTHMLLYAGEGDSVLDEMEEDLIGVEGKIQGIDKWQIWEPSDRWASAGRKCQQCLPGRVASGPVRPGTFCRP